MRKRNRQASEAALGEEVTEEKILEIPDLKSHASNYFTWEELLWLPKWSRSASAIELDKQILDNLKQFAIRMDNVREILSNPIDVHCCYRPPLYNKLVGGSKSSAHMSLGVGIAAMDFSVRITGDLINNCNAVRETLKPKLENLNMRMEDLPNSPWVHLDSKQPGQSGRFFKP